MLCHMESGLVPWAATDRVALRSAADYAARNQHYTCLLWMTAVGVMPTTRALEKGSLDSKIARLTTAARRQTTLPNLLASLARLGYFDIVFDLLDCVSIAARGGALTGLTAFARDAISAGCNVTMLRKLVDAVFPPGSLIGDGREELLATALLSGASIDLLVVASSGCSALTFSHFQRNLVFMAVAC